MKRSVLTITLNPAVDKISSVDNIIAEKKMRCAAPEYCPGGGGINVSRALKRLGFSSHALFTCGGRTGRMLEELLHLEQLDIILLPTVAETRENFIVLDKSTNKQYRFGFPGEPITTGEQKHLLECIDKLNPMPEFVVISGSIPPEMSADFIKLLIGKCKIKGSKVIVDTSGEALEAAVQEGVFLLKPNVGELATLSGKKELKNTDVDKAANHIISQGHATIVVVSLGSAGAILYSATEKIQMAPPALKILSTVGAGDSMVAGLLAVLCVKGSLEEMLRMGVACGSATTMAEGTKLFSKEDVDRVYSRVKRYR